MMGLLSRQVNSIPPSPNEPNVNVVARFAWPAMHGDPIGARGEGLLRFWPDVQFLIIRDAATSFQGENAVEVDFDVCGVEDL